jgi:uncharacterized protein (PEP-CTERM system associated)
LPLGLGIALYAAPAAAQDSSAGAPSGSGTAAGGTVGSSGIGAPSTGGTGGLGTIPGSTGSATGLGGLLPNVGAGPRVGDLRSQLLGLLGPQGTTAAQPPWIFSPSLGVELGITDNAREIKTPRVADVFTLISPQLIVSGDTANIVANLAYTPQFTVYAKNGALDQAYQSFNGQTIAQLVPNVVFLNLRGSITQGSETGVGQVQTQPYNTQNSVQTITYEVSPHISKALGSWGTGTVTYAFDQSLQSNTSNQIPFNNTAGQSAYGNVGNLTTNTETANFTTGENLNHFNINTTATASQYNGTQASNTGHSEDVNVELTYAVTHKVSLLSGIGYQIIEYGSSLGTNNGYNNTGITYNVGVTYTPNPDSSITLRYGRQDGSTNISFDAAFAPTSRTRLIARYTNGVTTNLQQAQNQLNNTSVSSNGTLIDNATGAPVLNSATGTQNSVYRDNDFSGTLLYLRDRDSYSISAGYEVRTTLTASSTLLNNGIVPAGTTTNSTYINLGWQHDLSPDMNFSATGQYGLNNNTGTLIGSGTQNTSTLSITGVLTKQFTETLSGSVRYTYTSQVGGQYVQASSIGNGVNTGTYSQNVFLVGLRKSF